MEYKRRNKLWAQNINGKKRRSDMEGMLDNPRNILLWITSESTSSESQNYLFVELHHTSIICLTSRSIKLMIEALFCSGNYVFSFAQLLQILVSISETVLSWYHGQVSGCVRLQLLPLLRPLIVYLISPLQTPRRAQPGSSTSSMHDQHHRRFYSKKSLGQMVAQNSWNNYV